MEPFAPATRPVNASNHMKNTDATNEINAAEVPGAIPQPNAINRRDMLVGTAGVAALTTMIAAQTAAAAQPAAPPAAPQGAPGPGAGARPGGAGPGARAGGPPGGGRGPVPAGSVTFNTVITKLKEGK